VVGTDNIDGIWVSFGPKVAVLPTIDVISFQLFFDIKGNGSGTSSVDIQTLLTVLFWLATHVVGVPVLLPRSMLYLVGKFGKNF